MEALPPRTRPRAEHNRQNLRAYLVPVKWPASRVLMVGALSFRRRGQTPMRLPSTGKSELATLRAIVSYLLIGSIVPDPSARRRIRLSLAAEDAASESKHRSGSMIRGAQRGAHIRGGRPAYREERRRCRVACRWHSRLDLASGEVATGRRASSGLALACSPTWPVFGGRGRGCSKR